MKGPSDLEDQRLRPKKIEAATIHRQKTKAAEEETSRVAAKETVNLIPKNPRNKTSEAVGLATGTILTNSPAETVPPTAEKTEVEEKISGKETERTDVPEGTTQEEIQTIPKITLPMPTKGIQPALIEGKTGGKTIETGEAREIIGAERTPIVVKIEDLIPASLIDSAIKRTIVIPRKEPTERVEIPTESSQKEKPTTDRTIGNKMGATDRRVIAFPKKIIITALQTTEIIDTAETIGITEALGEEQHPTVGPDREILAIDHPNMEGIAVPILIDDFTTETVKTDIRLTRAKDSILIDRIEGGLIPVRAMTEQEKAIIPHVDQDTLSAHQTLTMIGIENSKVNPIPIIMRP